MKLASRRFVVPTRSGMGFRFVRVLTKAEGEQPTPAEWERIRDVLGEVGQRDGEGLRGLLRRPQTPGTESRHASGTT